MSSTEDPSLLAMLITLGCLFSSSANFPKLPPELAISPLSTVPLVTLSLLTLPLSTDPQHPVLLYLNLNPRYVQRYDMSCGGLLPVCMTQSEVFNAFRDG